MTKNKKRQPKLPKKLLYIPSSDKDFIEKWSDIKNFASRFTYPQLTGIF